MAILHINDILKHYAKLLLTCMRMGKKFLNLNENYVLKSLKKYTTPVSHKILKLVNVSCNVNVNCLINTNDDFSFQSELNVSL